MWLCARFQARLVIQIREVEIARNSGSLGLCVKGGAEHRLPVLVSRVVEHSPADQCKQLLVGDAILRVGELLILVDSYSGEV